MGLDASVYCDCFEKGRLKKQPKPEWRVCIDEEGGLTTGQTGLELEELIEFDKWSYYEACEHEFGRLVSHRIGNIATVGYLRAILKFLKADIPVIWNKVIYSGSHAGDYLDVEDVKALRSELKIVTLNLPNERETKGFVVVFLEQMNELTKVALKVGKPIVF